MVKAQLFKSQSIKNRMLLAMAAFCVIIVIQLVVSSLILNRINEIDEVKDRVHSVEVKAFELRNSNLNYFANESRNSDYYNTGRSEYLYKTKRLYKEIKEELKVLMQNGYLSKLDVFKYLKTARVSFYKYQSYFHDIENHIRAMGYDDEGLVGEMNSKFKLLSESSDIDQLSVLQMMNAYKDFLIHSNPKFAEQSIDQANALIANASETDAEALKEYIIVFREFLDRNKEIGFDPNTGLKKALLAEAAKLDKELMKLTVKFNKLYKDEIRYLSLSLLVMALIIIISSVWLSLVFAKHLSRPIIKLVNKIKSAEPLSGGEEMHISKTAPKEVMLLDVEFTRMITQIKRQVSEIQDKKQELEGQNEELTQLNKELDRFIYHTSHDLRAPLTSISGLIEVVESSEDEDIGEYLKHMRFCIDQLDRTIVEIIHFYKNRSAEIKKEEVDILKMVSTIYSQNKFHPSAGGIEFKVENLGSGICLTDSYRLNIVLGNLITNAIKYHDTSKKDRFITTRIENQGTNISIEVRDNGSGISKEHLEKVFSMFYRASDLSTGSGLGLYIVSESVKKINGEINVVSEKGEGSIFTVTLPDQPVHKEHKEELTAVV